MIPIEIVVIKMLVTFVHSTDKKIKKIQVYNNSTNDCSFEGQRTHDYVSDHKDGY